MNDFFTSEEKKELFSLYRHLMQSAGDSISWKDCQKLKNHLIKAAQYNGLQRNNFGMNPVIKDLQTAIIVAEEIGMKGSCLIGIMLHEIVKTHILSIDEVSVEYGEDVASIIKGLVKTNELYAKSPAIESENFRNLLLSFAEDMRVILIMIADRVNVMRQIKDTGNEEDRIKVANEAAYLYAPLAHKLGLYKLKSELEDLSLKYTQRDTYYFIKDKLNETKASRDKYIAAFIEPIKKKVTEAGLKFDIKGRTKSIHSIWNKIQKQKTPFEGIYDLFAIRIILDSEPDPAKEKQECWQVYSIVTDMYQPNPKRLRDWLSSFLVCRDTDAQTAQHNCKMATEGRFEKIDIDKSILDKLEVIVVNDGTPDRSVEVAQKFVDWYPDTFVIVNKTNGGHGSAINTGVEHVRGKYLKVVDADDWVDTLALKHLVEYLEHVDSDAVIQSFRYYDISKDEYRPADVSVPDFTRAYNLKDIVNMWDDIYDGLSFHGVIYNTGFYKALGYKLTEHVFYEDQEYATVPFSYAKTVRFIQEELYVYRVGDVNQSVSAASQVKRLPDLEQVIFNVLEAEKSFAKMPQGGKEHFIRKTSGIITSYYQIALIKNTDRQSGRAIVEQFNMKLAQKSALMYEAVQRKYKVFRLFNKLHVSNSFYENQFAKLLELAKRVGRADRLYRK